MGFLNRSRLTCSPVGIMAAIFHKSIHSSDGILSYVTQASARAGRSGGDRTLGNYSWTKAS